GLESFAGSVSVEGVLKEIHRAVRPLDIPNPLDVGAVRVPAGDGDQIAGVVPRRPWVQATNFTAFLLRQHQIAAADFVALDVLDGTAGFGQMALASIRGSRDPVGAVTIFDAAAKRQSIGGGLIEEGQASISAPTIGAVGMSLPAPIRIVDLGQFTCRSNSIGMPGIRRSE